MEQYSLIWCNRYMDELLDKMGSDLFPLPVKFNRFKTICLDFIRESTEYLEASQEISDDIRPLLVREDFPIIKQRNGFLLPIPDNYLRLISIMPNTNEGPIAKKVSILREGQYQSYKRDPYRTSTDEYPSVFRHSNGFLIDVGDSNEDYVSATMSYITTPVYASLDNVQERIVNLPNISIEKILLKTCDSLRITTADNTGATSYQFTQTFGKKNS